MAKEEEKIFLPTQPAELRAGEPVDVQDWFKANVYSKLAL